MESRGPKTLIWIGSVAEKRRVKDLMFRKLLLTLGETSELEETCHFIFSLYHCLRLLFHLLSENLGPNLRSQTSCMVSIQRVKESEWREFQNPLVIRSL